MPPRAFEAPGSAVGESDPLTAQQEQVQRAVPTHLGNGAVGPLKSRPRKPDPSRRLQLVPTVDIAGVLHTNRLSARRSLRSESTNG
jgi:hypothetical protein